METPDISQSRNPLLHPPSNKTRNRNSQRHPQIRGEAGNFRIKLKGPMADDSPFADFRDLVADAASSIVIGIDDRNAKRWHWDAQVARVPVNDRVRVVVHL